MDTITARRTHLPMMKNLLFFGLLFGLSLLFFALVRDNTFWQYGDYLYLKQAIDIDQSWQEILKSAPNQPFQPLIKLIFYLEYSAFGLDAWRYYLFNIFVHALNAFLVYFLIMTLLKDRTIAVLSAVLFACAVGNYGKAVMVVSGISDLIITMLTLLTLLLYFKNELQKGGKATSVWFFATVFCFSLSLLTKATSFSILGCMLAFNFFFRAETKKSLFHRNFIILTVVAMASIIIKFSFLHDPFATQDLQLFSPNFFRYFGSYLVRMVFPIHVSSLVTHSGPVVQFIYNLATEIRVITFLIILSYSLFGFVFGNRAIRFFIMWTYITVLPFCFFEFPRDWLNIRYLYLVSVGFIMILAAGTVLASRLLYQRAWRRFLPYALPLLFVGLSQFIISHLDRNYEASAAAPPMQQMIAELEVLREQARFDKE
jgi:4-amino-4-deoxy-L-arabinose transferase-like glycosyltransferase